jgi:ABC-type hemin transport system ATPase subunit
LDGGRVVVDGTPTDVLSEDTVAAHYGADVQVIRDKGSVFVLPRRQGVQWVR